MKKVIAVEEKEPAIAMIEGITFAQVPFWFSSYPSQDLKLNLLRPFGQTEDKRPLLIWICGGAWITLDRGAHIPWLTGFAKQGYIVASIEYRCSNSAHFPAQLEDVKKAIRYLRAHANRFGIDSDKIAVMGESAGGYLAAMAGLTNGIKKYDVGENTGQESCISAVVDLYGPTYLTPDPPDPALPDPSLGYVGCPPLDMFLGYPPLEHPEKVQEASALSYVSAQAPPFFIAHGTADPVVPISNSERLYEMLEQCGARVDYYAIDGAVHASSHFYQEELFRKILAFLREVL